MLIFETNLDVVDAINYFLITYFDMKDLGEADVTFSIKITKNQRGHKS